MTYDIYTRALDILKNRENAWGNKAHETDNLTKKQEYLSMASAYCSAWWILWYANHENWDCLDQFDYKTP